ncbi:type VII secretion system-associated protein [Streptomyces sp. NRRL F-6677]|uniref:type VII secretion system-associated protein n=1 Tax=Streptomyces sp. NRRL F-6677 TaxID=1463879 RepID=UPI00068C463C|nr:type VII secretion system-associated protein [Streptomyces sp. NRRL F-6677]
MTSWPASPRPDTPPAPTASSGPAAPPGPPRPPEELVEAARLAPDHWISAVDPGWTGDGPPPAFAVAGRWRSGLGGEIEEWEENDAYRPSPRALGWPEPTDALDAALQGVVTGYGPPEDVALALAEAELLVLTLPDGSPVTATAADGTPVVPVFSAAAHLDLVGGFASARRTTAELVPHLPPGHRLYVNPAGPADAILDPTPPTDATDPMVPAPATDPTVSAPATDPTVSAPATDPTVTVPAPATDPTFPSDPTTAQAPQPHPAADGAAPPRTAS